MGCDAPVHVYFGSFENGKMTGETAKIRLAYFGFTPHYGGAQRSTIELCKYISGKAEVHIIDAYGSCQPYVDAIRSLNCPYHILCPDAQRTTIGRQGSVVGRTIGIVSAVPSLLRVRSRLAKVLCKISPDVIWVGGPKSLHVVSAVLGLKHIPVIYYLRGNYRPDQVSASMRVLFRHLVTHFVAVSTVTKKNVCKMGVGPERIDVIFNLVDVEEVTQRAKEAFLDDLPGTKADIRILLPGTLVREKGQLCAIGILRCLVEKGHNAILWLAGDIPSGAGTEYLEILKSEIIRLDLEEKAFILGWRKDILPIMSKATIVLLPSHTEGMPRTILEAMAIGRPVVATSVGGIPDLIKDGQTGLLVDVDDTKGFVKSIERLVDANFAERIVLNAKKHIQEHCSAPIQQSKVLKVMRKVAGHKK